MTGIAILAVLVAGEPDAGVLVDAYRACPDASDAGEAKQMDGGWWLPDPRGARLACRLASCEAYAEAPPVVTPALLIMNVATLVLGIIASIVTFVVRK